MNKPMKEAIALKNLIEFMQNHSYVSFDNSMTYLLISDKHFHYFFLQVM